MYKEEQFQNKISQDKYIRLGKLIILCCVGFIIFKTLFSYSLFRNATYGMPALIKEGHADQLFIGSSMFRQGIDIQTLNEYFPEKENYILAYNGNQPIWEYYQLKYLLENDVTIDRVYIDMYIYSMIEVPKLSDEKMFLEFDFQNKRDIFSCVKDNLSITDMWHMWVGSCNEMLFFWPIYRQLINSQFENGGTKTNNAGASKQVLDEIAVPDLSSDINEIQYLYLQKIAEMAKKNNIELIFIETPKYTKVDEDYQYKEKMSLYRTTAKTLGIQELDIIADFNHADASNYIDIIHLSEKGRNEFTSMVCDAINVSEDNDL